MQQRTTEPLPLIDLFSRAYDERQRQDAKWGADRRLSDDHWNRILVEEVGEVSRALNDHDSAEHLEEELIQVASVCLAWIQSRHLQGIDTAAGMSHPT